MAQKVEYIVEVSRTGTGAGDAVADLNKVNAAAALSNTAFVNVEKSTKSAAAGLKAMSNVAVLVGGSTFPQATLAAQTLKESFHAIKLAAAASGTSVAAVAGPIAVIAAGIATTYRAVKEFLNLTSAMEVEKQSAINLAASAANQGKRISDALIAAMQEGRVKISAERAAIWDAILAKPSPEALASLRKTISTEMPNLFLSEGERSKMVSQRMADQEREIQLTMTTAQAAGNNKEAQEELNIAYSKRLGLLNDLSTMGLLTEKQFTDAANDAAIKENQRLIERKSHLTDIQSLQRQALETSAASLAAMALDYKNAQQAALDLIKTIAQMIIQFLIMQAIRASFPSLFPVPRASGGQDVNMAARGGFFPTLAANGVNGVREVSTPTYFPRFNVLAGEAGREVMTVMARPRLMNIGGIAAQVGDVGLNRLALTNAGDLQRIGNGSGGHFEFVFHTEPGWRAEIVRQSADSSVHIVTKKLRERGPLSDNVRRLSNQ